MLTLFIAIPLVVLIAYELGEQAIRAIRSARKDETR